MLFDNSGQPRKHLGTNILHFPGKHPESSWSHPSEMVKRRSVWFGLPIVPRR
jgi:hypothetical protein